LILTKLVIGVLGSLVLAYISRASLLNPRSHGFYRFFAWEAILALALRNILVWFQNPFAWYQLISWLLLVIEGFRLLKELGQQNEQRAGAPMLEFEKTTHLVTIGAYRYIRHPLYSSLLFLLWGIFFKQPSLPGLLLAVAGSVFLYLTARVEEGENNDYFGDEYRNYIQKSKMFIPFVF
jgi:protein-S-isoprenylcysteine O-methyltransferase Ste14